MTDDKKIQEVMDTLDKLKVYSCTLRGMGVISYTIRAKDEDAAERLAIDFLSLEDLSEFTDWSSDDIEETSEEEIKDGGLIALTVRDLEKAREDRKKKISEVINTIDNKKPFLVQHTYVSGTSDAYLAYARTEHEADDMARNANPNFGNVTSTRIIDLKKITILEE